MRQTFDDYNETCLLIDGSAAIHPYNLGLLILRGISSTGPFGHAKQCAINAFDTDYLLSADEMMANILHPANNMDEEVITPGLPAPDTSPPPTFAFVAAGRCSHIGRGHTPRGPRGRGLPNKCRSCGSPEQEQMLLATRAAPQGHSFTPQHKCLRETIPSPHERVL
jgi:hypothetical protein